MKHLNSIDNFILENKKYESWNKIQNKIIDDHKLNGYVFLTFGLTITSLYPMIETIILTLNLPKINTDDVVLLTIAVLTILLNESKDDVNKLLILIKERNLDNHFNKLKELFNNIFNIFKIIGSKLGKVIVQFSDMLAYTSIAVPFIQLIQEFTQMNGVDFIEAIKSIKNVDGKLISLAIGTSTISLKHIFINFISRFKEKLSWKREKNIDKLDDLSNEINENFKF